MSRNFELLQKAEAEHEIAEPHALPWAGPSAVGHLRTVWKQESTDSAVAVQWLRLWKIVRQRWVASVIFAAAVVAGTMLLTLLTRPEYEPVTEIEIIPPGTELFSLEARGGSANDAEYLETQAKTVKSDELAIAVIRQLHLDQNPDVMAPSAFSAIAGPIFSAVQRVQRMVWGGSQPTTVAANELRLTPLESKALLAFQERLTVKRDTASRLVDISFTSHDPLLAEKVTNAVVSTLIERTYATRHEAVMRSTEWLARQLDDIRAKMENSNRALAEFQSVVGIASLDENRSTFTEEMAELSRQKTQAAAERIQLQSYLNKADTSGQMLPQVQNNPVIQQLTQKLADIRAELSQNLAVNGEKHPTTRRLRNQISELEAQLRLQRREIVAQMRNSFSAATTREQMLDREMKGTGKSLEQMARYTALKKEAEANAALYNALYARVKEAGIAAASKSSNIRIVDKARVLNVPTRPRPLLNLAVSVLAALLGGLLLALVRETLDTRIHTVEDVRRCTGMPAISILPAGDFGKAKLPLRKWSLGLLPGGKSPARSGVLPQFLKDQPGSVQAEAMRSLHTSIMLSQPQRPPQVLLVVSSLPTEGKSTVAINLALALAQQNSTCLVDADLRRPVLGRAFGLQAEIGLGEHLADSVPLQSILFPIADASQLTLLPAGAPICDPGKLISSEKIRQTIQTLRQHYAFVVIDSPPLLPYADGRALSPFVDGVILVGRAGVVTREAMVRTIELLQEVNSAPILDIVLNLAEMERHEYDYYYKRYA